MSRKNNVSKKRRDHELLIASERAKGEKKIAQKRRQQLVAKKKPETVTRKKKNVTRKAMSSVFKFKRGEGTGPDGTNAASKKSVGRLKVRVNLSKLKSSASVKIREGGEDMEE